jgi:peptidoglycan-associated lipoprotein
MNKGRGDEMIAARLGGRHDMRKAKQRTSRGARLLVAALGVCAVAMTLSPRAAAQDAGKLEVGGDYNYVRTNVPPGGCGCINMNGGDGWLSYKVAPSWAIVGQIGVQHASNIGGSGGADLTFTSYLFGPRVSRRVGDRLVPFAQVLLGGAHASGSLAPQNSGLGGSANAFALTAGGGLDIGLTRHIAIRAAELDYYLTRFDNGVNERQNNFKFSAGVVFRF